MSEQIIIGVAAGLIVLTAGGSVGFVLATARQVSRHAQWMIGADITLQRHEKEIDAGKERCAAHAHFFGEISSTLLHLKNGMDKMEKNAHDDKIRAESRGHNREGDMV